MKIRTWLMVTYLIVMTLPIIAAYGFYILLQEWDKEQGLQNSFELTSYIHELEEKLQDPDLYKVQSSESFMNKLFPAFQNEDVELKLYENTGLYLFNSKEPNNAITYETNRATLFKDLYQYDFSYRSVAIKKPVFLEDEMIGIYSLNVERTEWIEGVQSRRTWIIISFFTLFISLYCLMIWLLHKRLNQPLSQLMEGMQEFASTHKPVTFSYRKQNEIGELIQHFESMQTQIEEAQRTTRIEQQEKQTMIASLSHDIKTPLTSLRAYAEALASEESLTQEQRKEYVQTLIRKSTHLQNMMEDLTIFTQLQSSTYSFDLQLVDGAEFVDMLFEGYDQWVRKEKITLHTHNSIKGSFCMNDRQMIRFLDNLLSNALQHTHSKGHIWIGAFPSAEHALPDWIFPESKEYIQNIPDHHCLIVVQNEGKAIAQKDLEHIFTPFYQGESSRTQKGNVHVGLGLSIANRIVELHGGRFHVWSVPGKGTIMGMSIKQYKEGEMDYE
ncbi:ATP-binding protein [Pontibacillus salicampi]|uniref:histidine kinase n=1 Tax=Pontibacillus salicampi TaxID=1449801 RepID=A0ABV6LMH9_9BACI